MAQYERIHLIGDLNLGTTEKHMEHFCDTYHLKNLVKEPTCFKNPNKPCINLFLTNCSKSFQDTEDAETELSDFHKMNITVLKMFYTKQKHNILFYRSYNTLDNKKFRTKLENELMKFDITNTEFQTLHNIVLSVLNKNALLKQKHLSKPCMVYYERYAKSYYKKIAAKESFLET